LEPTLVLAPDALIRSRGGRLLVHTTTSSLPAFESDQPMLIGWLCQFATPRSAVDALADLPEGDREAGARLIDYLVRGGTLIAADTAKRQRNRLASTCARSRARCMRPPAIRWLSAHGSRMNWPRAAASAWSGA